MKVIPLDRVGLYVPGGKASYPSSVVMNAVPALVAGVQEIVAVVPPQGVTDAVLAACALSGVTRIFRIGGAQAVGALAFIGQNARIGDNVRIHPQAFIGDNVTIGDNTTVHPGVKIYADCTVGRNCILHSNTVIGSDGFRFAVGPGGGAKVPQIGNVVIEDDVEIGANCAIDRATLGSTILRKGVKFDNLIHIAHNVEVGENTYIAAANVIAGSTKVGRNCMFSGQVGIVGHLKIADNTILAAGSGVSKSITKPGEAYMGSPAFDHAAGADQGWDFEVGSAAWQSGTHPHAVMQPW